MTVKLSGRLPDFDRSGLERLYGSLVRTPERRHVAIVVLDCSSTKVDHGADGDVFTPTAGVVFAEPLADGEDIDTVLEILGRVRAERLNEPTLDFDFGVADPFEAAAQKIRDNVTEVTFNGRTVFGGGPDASA